MKTQILVMTHFHWGPLVIFKTIKLSKTEATPVRKDHLPVHNWL